MSEDKLRSVTYRIPEGLASAIDYVAKARGMTVADFVRRSLEQAIDPKAATPCQLPGMTKEFAEFLEERAPKDRPSKALVLLAVAPRGQQTLYYGSVSERAGSIVTLLAPDLVPIPHASVHSWYPVDEPNTKPPTTLILALVQEGWRPFARYLPTF